MLSIFEHPVYIAKASLVPQVVMNLPAKWKARVPSLDQDHPLEKGMATHSSILA